MSHHYQRAFSLHELLISLSIITILGLIAIPSYGRWREHNQHQALHNELLATLRAARAYSVTHNRTVEVCGSTTGHSCDTHWQTGWRIQQSHDEQSLHVTQLGQSHALYWSGFSPRIRFRPNGLAPTSNGTFVLCNREARAVWALVINRQGRVRSETQSAALRQRDNRCAADAATNHRQ